MKTKQYTNVLRLTALLLAAALVLPLPITAAAADDAAPRASDYLTSYNSYIYPAGWGKVQVWFTVTAADDMDDLGVLKIQLYESTDGGETWSWVTTYTHTSDTSLLGHDDYYYSGHVEYNGTIGRYYKAYVCIWAGRDGGGDTRYIWTQPKKATLFAA